MCGTHSQDTVEGNSLSGRFRSSDIGWSPDVTRVEQVLLKPGFPPMHLVADNNNVVSELKMGLIHQRQNLTYPPIMNQSVFPE